MKFLTAGILLFVCAVASADVLVLDDGTQLQGKVHKSGDQWIVTDAQGHETAVDGGNIKSFEFGGNGGGGGGGGGGGVGESSALDRLASLRNSVDHLSDLNEIISRYQRFIKQNAGDAVVAAANTDLAMWQRRSLENYQKIGGRWLTPMEREVLAEQEAQSAAAIGDLIRQGQDEEAMKAIMRALADDSDNPSALYLQGLLLYPQDQIAAARADFDRVAAMFPGHAPTLNNLGVVMCRQQQFGAAMIAYWKAMNARPVDQAILDNVAEALHALPDTYKDNGPAKKTAAVFAEQDKQLQKLQEARGLYRWGSNWVPADQLARLTAEQASRETQLASLREEERQAEAVLDSNAAELQSTQRLYDIFNPPNQYGVVSQQVPSPSDYIQLQQDLVTLSNAREVGLEHLKHIQERIEKVQRNYSLLPYSGAQHLIGPEGTPIRAEQPVGAATQPGDMP